MHPPLSAAHRLAQPPRPGFKSGGLILGPGTGTSDSIPADVPEGTFIMPADSTQRLGLAARALGGDVPVKVSSGEFEISPEQVQQIGASVLDLLRGVTHTPVEVEQEERQAFADGGMVSDISRVGNSYSGGNVGGSITINGQAPGGTFSQFSAGAAVAPPAAPAIPAAAPMAAAPAPAVALASPAATPAPAAPMGWSERNAQRNLEVSASSIMPGAARATAQSALAGLGQPLPAPVPATPRPAGASAVLGQTDPSTVRRPGFANGGLVQDTRRQDLIGQIPTGGMQAPVADGSQSNPLNNEIGRNALNTLAALPGTSGIAARAGAAGGRAASGLPAVAERVTPAAWELVDDAGALATRTGSQAGGALTRAATMAPESGRAAQLLGGPAGQLAPRGATQIGEAIPMAGQRARAATPYADIVEPMALGAPAAGQAAQGAAGATAASLSAGRMAAAGAAGAAGIGAAALLGGDSSASASMPHAEPGLAAPQGGPAAPAGQPGPAGTAEQPGNFITRDGNSYSGPAGLGGEVPIRNADGSTRAEPAFSSLPSGNSISAQNMTAADALAGRQAAESMARLGIEGPGPGFSGVIGQQGNGNMWGRTPDQQRRDAEVQASSIHRPTAARGAGALLGMDVRALQELRNRGALDATQLQETGANNRAAMKVAGDIQGENIRAQGLTLKAVIDARKSGQPPTGYQWTPGGGLTHIPGGPADPNVRGNRAPLNDTQSKALQFGTRMQEAGTVLDRMSAVGVNQPGLIKRGADAVGLGAVANFTQSSEQQQVEQAQRDFINAVLRRESGAAIADSEFSNANKQYFIQPGDSPEVQAQKRRNREIATAGILAEVPDSEKRVSQVLTNAAANQPAGAPPDAGAAISVTDAASYAAVPVGALYTTPNGEVRRKK